MSSSNNGTESTPLIQSTTPTKPYYFLSGRRDSIDESIQRLPAGATEDEFASRPVMMVCIYIFWYINIHDDGIILY